MASAPIGSSMHVFESAGLGKAPYKFLGVEELRGPIQLGNGVSCGSPGQPMGSCQYCSTGIAYLFWLQPSDGGKPFYVGSDCIFKSGDAGLRRVIDPIVAKHNADVLESRSKALIATFEAFLVANPTFWADDRRPHPHSWRAQRGETMGMYNRYVYENRWNGLTKKARLARQFLIGANVPLPEIAAKRVKKACLHTYLKKNPDVCRKCGAPKPVPVVHYVAGTWGGIRIVDLGD